MSSASTRTRTPPAVSKKSQAQGRSDRSVKHRREARRIKASRRLKALMALTGICALAVLVIAFVNSSLADVDSVSVVGAVNADEAVIVQESGIRPGQRLIEVDQGESARRVELVPWVGAAEVRRSLGGDIEIAVVEREAITALPTVDGGFALVDRGGLQLEVVETRPSQFVPVDGVVVSGIAGEFIPPEATPILSLVELMPPVLVEEVSTITMDGQELVVDLVVGGRARFGDGTEIEQKIQAMRTVLERVDLDCLALIDLSVPSAPSVRRINADTTASGDGNQETKAASSGC